MRRSTENQFVMVILGILSAKYGNTTLFYSIRAIFTAPRTKTSFDRINRIIRINNINSEK